MTATKIDGTAIAKSIRERLGEQIKSKQESNPRYRPSLKIVQGESGHGYVGDDGMLIDA
jgi:methylenetetrahydrofolate dehydrogenase (NADP+)/methenyltetrahydrofolate cyclohydrolase/formyltetrahydrofolate synthetase